MGFQLQSPLHLFVRTLPCPAMDDKFASKKVSVHNFEILEFLHSRYHQQILQTVYFLLNLLIPRWFLGET